MNSIRIMTTFILILLLISVEISFGYKNSFKIRNNVILKPLSFHQVVPDSILKKQNIRLNTLLYSKNTNDNSFNSITNTNNNNLTNNFELSESQCYLILNFVAILFGTQHVCIKALVGSFTSTSLVNFWRFLLSALLFSPALFQTLSSYFNNNNINDDDSNNDSNNDKSMTIKGGIELGIYTFLGFAFQSIGLETTTASRSAFLLYLNVKFVPFILSIVFKRKIPLITWLSAFLAFFGTFLISNDGAPPNTGDIWCIGAAISSALYIIRLENYSTITDNNNNNNNDNSGSGGGVIKADELNSISFATVASLSFFWVIGDMIFTHPELTYTHELTLLASQIIKPFILNPWPVIYLGVVTTAVCNYLQTLGQRRVPAERAAILYSIDPVYGAIFSRFILDERLGTLGYVGAAMILSGVALSAIQTFKKNN